jgi:hypothetical protein
MRSLQAARRYAKNLADRTGHPHVIWSQSWRIFVQPEGKEVPNAQELETVYPEEAPTPA